MWQCDGEKTRGETDRSGKSRAGNDGGKRNGSGDDEGGGKREGCWQRGANEGAGGGGGGVAHLARSVFYSTPDGSRRSSCWTS